MKSILEEFAYGNISPEVRSFGRDSECGCTMKKLTDSEDKLFAVLNESEREILTDFSNAQMEINMLSGVDRFIYGYRLGVLMIIEVFNGSDDLIADDLWGRPSAARGRLIIAPA